MERLLQGNGTAIGPRLVAARACASDSGGPSISRGPAGDLPKRLARRDRGRVCPFSVCGSGPPPFADPGYVVPSTRAEGLFARQCQTLCFIAILDSFEGGPPHVNHPMRFRASSPALMLGITFVVRLVNIQIWPACGLQRRLDAGAKGYGL